MAMLITRGYIYIYRLYGDYHHPSGELSIVLILLMPYVADMCRLLGLSIHYCWLGDMLMVYILMAYIGCLPVACRPVHHCLNHSLLVVAS